MGNSTKELVNAFNLNNYFSDEINANFTVEGKKIVGLFASGTNIGEYLRRIGEEIVERHYLSGTKVAGAFYNLNCFPFVLGANPDKEYLGNGIVKVKLADSTDPAVIHNLKINFANEFERAVISKVVARLQKAGITKKEAYEWIKGTVGTGAIGKPYLYCIAFSDEYLDDSETFEMVKEMYIQEFNSRLKECHVKSSDFYEYKDDMLYIKDVSDKVVKSVTEYVKKEIAFYFRTPGKEDSKVENFKDVLSSLMSKRVRKFINTYDYDIFTDEKKIQNGDSFVLIPLIEMDDGQFETLSSRNASKINGIFNGFHCISDIRGKTANPQFANCKEPVYAFSNKGIAQLLPKIMESPIAYNERNGRFEFAVDLENFKRRGSSRSSSTVTSPFNSPTHAEPPRTPPNQRKADTDSGYDSNSPPKPKDSGSSSGGPSSGLTQLSSPTQEFPTRSPDGALEDSPRQGSEKFPVLLPVNQLDVPGTSREFLPRSHLSSSVTNPHSSKCVGAVQNVQAGTSAWSQPIGFWSSPAPSLWSFSQSGPSSWRGASERRTSDKPLTEEEEKLSKALLYSFNLNNYALDPPHTNFIVKNGKIASLIDDSVNVKEYLQEVIDKTKEEYRVNKKEAYDLNEFPFKFLSNCEKNQETTVVANISRGALLNLKKLFIWEYAGKLEIKDINIDIVKKDVESKKDKWVNSQVREHGLSPKEAIETCYPDESVLEYISITKDEGGYWIDRGYDGSEVKSFREERWPAKGTSVAKKGKLEDNKDSGISSGEATDAENVSSKAEGKTSGYESMDYENTGGKSPKRTLELSVENLRISTGLDATKIEQPCSPAKKSRSQ
ncbi:MULTISPECIES: hypothetical protein [unclassified Wolbachia]|uniref:hypothetical protein n=1 Tax=unclassified Wolbachia TaxID=2640676 RepID=UPI002231AB11|nr:hypothetical protein [Wolbachia endosymbiont (group A) of Apoderus coryli]